MCGRAVSARDGVVATRILAENGGWQHERDQEPEERKVGAEKLGGVQDVFFPDGRMGPPPLSS
jgi:hypothetical protein